MNNVIEKVILLRDYSQESEEAENILSKSGVQYARVFGEGEKRPCIVSRNGKYNGKEGVKRFVQTLQSKKG